MSQTEYLMPDYYPDFACKMGACRCSCCCGWPVALSEEEYFRLVGMDCPVEMRQSLDCALRMAEYPTKERYGEIGHTYEGKCRLLLLDGRCSVHARLGEEVLPLVCRLYPRAIRGEGDHECSCSASCEAVASVLLFKREPLTFIYRPISTPVPPEGKTDYAEIFPREQQTRLYFIKLMQDRSVPIYVRLYRLGVALMETDAALQRNAMPDFDGIFSENARIYPGIDEAYAKSHLDIGLALMEKIVAGVDAHAQSICDYGEEALTFFGKGEESFRRYELACEKFNAAFPHWEEGFERLLCNHMFYSRFPFADGKESMYDEYLSIAGVYTMLRFLAVGCTGNNPSKEKLEDVTAAFFRLAEHADFHPYIAGILRKEAFCTPDQITLLSHL